MLYEGDVWLSNSSLKLLGVFTSIDTLKVFLKDMLDREIIDQYGYDCLSGEILSARWQTQMDDAAFMVDFVEPNPTEYDN